MAANNFPKFNKKDGSNKLDGSSSSDEANNYDEAERYHKFKIYRELIKSHGLALDSPPVVDLSDRHNYFKNLHPHIKADAMAVLHSPDYGEDFQRQAMDVFKALKITPRFAKFSSEQTNEDILQIDTDCEYDLIFANVETKVYQDILSYFRDMLD